MKLRWIIIAIGLMSFGGGAVAQSLLLGPKGRFTTGYIGEKLEYDPSKGCYKPTRPFSDDRFAWDMYRNEGERYLSCLESAATSDMGYARLAVQKGYEDAVQDFLDEVERGF